ncbi:MAG: hypothetical protein PHX83_12205 [Acidobacteriia bacterium]|nr:hypothetical protein [Terriglobia bacterium]
MKWVIVFSIGAVLLVGGYLWLCYRPGDIWVYNYVMGSGTIMMLLALWKEVVRPKKEKKND